MTVAPIDLFGAPVHLQRGGTVRTGSAAGPLDLDGWQLRTFHAKTAADVHADHWEVHPEADEVVSCLIGKIRLCLRPERPGQEEEEVILAAGTAAFVPRGRWHRIELVTPSSIMAVTMPRGSRSEERAEA